MPPMLLRLMMNSRIAISGPRLGSRIFWNAQVRSRSAGQRRTQAMRRSCSSLWKLLAAVDLGVVGGDRSSTVCMVDDVVAVQRVHALDQFRQRVRDDDVFAVACQFVVEPAIAEQQVERDAQSPSLADRGVELGARYREFLERDAPVQQLPAVPAGLGADARDEFVRVEAGDERRRGRCARRAN